MSSTKFEQRINLKFLVKLGKNQHEAFHLLKKAYGDNCISRACAFACFDEYSKSLEKLETKRAELYSKVEEIRNVEMSNTDNDKSTENTTPSNMPSSTRRIRSNSVIDSIGFKKYSAVLAANMRNRSKSLSTTDYYRISSEQYQYSDNLHATETFQSNEIKKSDTIDAHASTMTPIKIGDDNNLATSSLKKPSKPTAFMPVSKTADCYNMNHKNRGKCIIFNHEEFDIGFEKRKGSDLDATRLQKTFGKLGFDVELHNDFTHSEIIDKIKEVSQLDHTDNDCLCIITLTHGTQNDLICAKDVAYKSDRLWKPFTADKCRTLAGKPKLFFFQACRGEEADSGVILSSRSFTQTETDAVRLQSYTIPTHADFLIAHSSVQGYFTWRNPTEGTWYIQCLCDVLDEHGTTMELMSMLTLTARKIAIDFASVNSEDTAFHDKKQVPSVTTVLIRSVYFPPKLKEKITS